MLSGEMNCIRVRVVAGIRISSTELKNQHFPKNVAFDNLRSQKKKRKKLKLLREGKLYALHVESGS